MRRSEKGRGRVSLPVKLLTGGVAVVALSSGCGEQKETGGGARAEDEAFRVYVVNYPLQYFAQRIGGDLIRVEFPAPPTVDPAYWKPATGDVIAYQTADLILLNGAGYAGWVGMASLPASKIVNTSERFADRYIQVQGATTHSHGPEGEHSHGETAFTTWLDPALAVGQAEAIRASLIAALPDHEASFTARFEALKRDLMSVDAKIGRALEGVRSEPLLGSHPVYQYFARRYGLNLKSVHFEPDEVPDVNSWWQLQQLRREHPARWMIWEAEPLPEIVTRLEEIGVKSVVFDPCANAPDTGDYSSVMQANARNLERAFGPG